MYKLRSSLLFITIISLGILVPFFGFAKAQSGELSVTPAFHEVSLTSEEKEKELSISIHNSSETSYRFGLSVLDFGSLDETGGVAFLGASQDLEKKYSLASWMRLEKDTLSIGGGETETLHVTIENRESLSPGGHYGAIIFRATQDENNEPLDNTVAVNQLLSVLIFVKKVGGEVYRVDLKDVDVERSFWKVPSQVSMRFENSGNVHVTPRGRATVHDPLGRLVSKGVLNEESALILPESLRIYKVPVKAIGHPFIPGKYILGIEYRYDGKDDFEKREISFYYIPPVFTGVLVLLLFVSGIFLNKRFSEKLYDSTK